MEQTNSNFLSPKDDAGIIAFTQAVQQVSIRQPIDIKALNHNDVLSFVHSWFAGFDHIESAEFFLAHLDNKDMTFNMDGQVLASDHTSFRAWFADALKHIPWDYHHIISPNVTRSFETGWTVEFFVQHVGEWHDIPIGDPNASSGRPFNRIIRVHWRLEHDGKNFIIRRY